MMACALSGKCCSISASASLLFNKPQPKKRQNLQYGFRIRASSADDADECNTEECAPDKEVGKVSMEWVAVEKTKVVGTFPPRKRGWTGYVEKDTAGQTNIYSVEPAVYIAESAISSGTAGSSSDGAENTAAIVGGIALVSIAAASAVLLQVGKNPPVVQQTVEYSGPSLSYYINKFTPPPTVEVSTAPPPVSEDASTTLQTETSIEQADSQPPPLASDVS
ncbi:protein MAINTENANCE OF PSII UNDER HIGH LIGHT 1 [Salvia miltiorrhiza]|uniref:protein MAINTENANCE OF PSII UNDER HIGH LIGHT 1 n=1 Tax=Salvia miltiorrhiza TaxID=226208 RepID=UPI0025ABCC01|nr:protein MAINTENANCE OF PSII UNDER HIGH LIGHT 1 [Salvia miltiorrhiza]